MVKSWKRIREYDPKATDETQFNGRHELYTDAIVVNEDNIIDVIDSNIFEIYDNYTKIKMLKNYEKGIQPILNRDKKVRAEINNRVVINHAHEIKEFKKGFIFGSPVTFVQRAREDIASDEMNVDEVEKETDIAITDLNEMMFEQSKGSRDLTLADDFLIGGVAYRIILPNLDDTEESAFKIYPLKAEKTFIIYSNDVYHNKVLSGTFIIRETGNVYCSCYTDTQYFELEGSLGAWEIKKVAKNEIGINPIVEYRYNNALMGCFEPVITLINAINTVSSDRVNGVAQFIQAILWLNNIQLDADQVDELMQKGCLQTSDIASDKQAQVQWLASELNQTSTQTVVDDFTSTMLEIAGVPSREVSTGGNTGQAIMLSNGWQIAETEAQAFEELYRECEKNFLKVVLKIISQSAKVKNRTLKELKLSDVETQFNRNRTDNLLIKVQGLQGMEEAGVHPRIAFELCGLFADPQQSYVDSIPYLEKFKYDSGEDTQDLNDIYNNLGEEDSQDANLINELDGMDMTGDTNEEDK